MSISVDAVRGAAERDLIVFLPCFVFVAPILVWGRQYAQALSGENDQRYWQSCHIKDGLMRGISISMQ